MTDYKIGDRVQCNHAIHGYTGTIREVQKTGCVIVMTDDRRAIQSSTRQIETIEGKGQIVAKKKKKKEKSTAIVITITLQSDAHMTKASIMAERGDLAYLHVIDHVEGQTDWNAVVTEARKNLVATEINPPKDIVTTKDDTYEPGKEKVLYGGYTDTEISHSDIPWQDYEHRIVPVDVPIINGKTPDELKAALVATHLMNAKAPEQKPEPVVVSKPVKETVPVKEQAIPEIANKLEQKDLFAKPKQRALFQI